MAKPYGEYRSPSESANAGLDYLLESDAPLIEAHVEHLAVVLRRKASRARNWSDAKRVHDAAKRAINCYERGGKLAHLVVW